MPYVDRGEARIWYTEQGTGFPVLALTDIAAATGRPVEAENP